MMPFNGDVCSQTVITLKFSVGKYHWVLSSNL